MINSKLPRLPKLMENDSKIYFGCINFINSIRFVFVETSLDASLTHEKKITVYDELLKYFEKEVYYSNLTGPQNATKYFEKINQEVMKELPECHNLADMFLVADVSRNCVKSSHKIYGLISSTFLSISADSYRSALFTTRKRKIEWWRLFFTYRKKFKKVYLGIREVVSVKKNGERAILDINENKLYGWTMNQVFPILGKKNVDTSWRTIHATGDDVGLASFWM